MVRKTDDRRAEDPLNPTADALVSPEQVITDAAFAGATILFRTKLTTPIGTPASITLQGCLLQISRPKGEGAIAG